MNNNDWYTLGKWNNRTGNITTDRYPVVNNVLWIYNCTGNYDQFQNVICVDGIVYMIGKNKIGYQGHNETRAIWLSNGTQKWNTTTGGSDAGPTYYDDDTGQYIFVQAGMSTPDPKELRCLWASNGTQKWNFSTPKGYNGSYGIVGGNPAIYAENNTVITVACGVIYAVNITTGKEIWNITLTYYPSARTIGDSATVFQDKVYVGCYNTGLWCIDARDSSIYWHNNSSIFAWDSSPCIVNISILNEGQKDVLFIGSGGGSIKGLFCFNISNGEAYWSNFTASFTHTTPAYDKETNTIFIGGFSGFSAMNASTGAYIWNNTWSTYVYTSPAISNGYVYFGSSVKNRVFCYTVDGVEVWNRSIGKSVFGGMCIYDNVLLFCADDWNLYAIGSLNEEIRITANIITTNAFQTYQTVISIFFISIMVSILLSIVIYIKSKGE